MLPLETRKQVVSYCNRDLVPDSAFDAQEQYHSQWFADYFSFLQNTSLSQHLGDAFYQARFIYKLMSALKLPFAKQNGIVKLLNFKLFSMHQSVRLFWTLQ